MEPSSWRGRRVARPLRVTALLPPAPLRTEQGGCDGHTSWRSDCPEAWLGAQPAASVKQGRIGVWKCCVVRPSSLPADPGLENDPVGLTGWQNALGPYPDDKKLLKNILIKISLL